MLMSLARFAYGRSILKIVLVDDILRRRGEKVPWATYPKALRGFLVPCKKNPHRHAPQGTDQGKNLGRLVIDHVE